MMVHMGIDNRSPACSSPRKSLSRLARVALLGAALLASACGGVPGFVEGEVQGAVFSIADTAPVARRAARTGGLHVLLGQEDGDTLRTANLILPARDALVVGKPIAIEASGDTTLELVEGQLVVMTRSDGARVLSSDNNRFHQATTGEVTIEALDELTLSGTFRAELESGGWAEGRFDVELPQAR